MSENTRELITWTLGTITTLCVLLGLAVRFILVPYLREHVIKPVKQVEKQVSENAHANKTPTVLDKIDDVQSGVDDVTKRQDEMAIDMKLLREMFKGHIEWSEEWVERIEKDVHRLGKRKRGWFR